MGRSPRTGSRWSGCGARPGTTPAGERRRSCVTQQAVIAALAAEEVEALADERVGIADDWAQDRGRADDRLVDRDEGLHRQATAVADAPQAAEDVVPVHVA